MGGLTLLEASELVSQIEETFGVDASASGGVMMAAPGAAGGAGGEAAEEKTDFDVVITEVDASKKMPASRPSARSRPRPEGREGRCDHRSAFHHPRGPAQ